MVSSESHNTCLSNDRKTKPEKLLLKVNWIMSLIRKLSREGKGGRKSGWLQVSLMIISMLAASMHCSYLILGTEKSRDRQLPHFTRYGPVCV